MCEQYPVLKLNDLLARTDDVADSYCTSSLVLKMLLIRIAHPYLYCTSSLMLHMGGWGNSGK